MAPGRARCEFGRDLLEVSPKFRLLHHQAHHQRRPDQACPIGRIGDAGRDPVRPYPQPRA